MIIIINALLYQQYIVIYYFHVESTTIKKYTKSGTSIGTGTRTREKIVRSGWRIK